MSGVALRVALVAGCVLLAALAWLFAPAALIGDDAGEFPLVASLVAVFAALTLAGRLEDRLSRH